MSAQAICYLPDRSLAKGLPAAAALLLLLPLQALAACPASHPHLGFTEYNEQFTTPVGAGTWVATKIDLPITIIGHGSVGVWQRVIHNDVTVETTTVTECYATRWDRLWARRGVSHTRTDTTSAPVASDSTQTAFCTTDDPPPDDLPGKSQKFVSATPPSGSGRDVMATVASSVAARFDYPTLMPATETFASILVRQSAGFIAASADINGLVAELGGVDDPVGLRGALLADFSALSSGLQGIGLDLQDGVVDAAGPLLALANALDHLALRLVQAPAEFPRASLAAGNLGIARDALLDAIVQFNSDFYNSSVTRSVEGTLFLKDLNALGASFGAFAGQAVAIPEPPLPGLLLIAAGAALWSRQRRVRAPSRCPPARGAAKPVPASSRA